VQARILGETTDFHKIITRPCAHAKKIYIPRAAPCATEKAGNKKILGGASIPFPFHSNRVFVSSSSARRDTSSFTRDIYRFFPFSRRYGASAYGCLGIWFDFPCTGKILKGPGSDVLQRKEMEMIEAIVDNFSALFLSKI